MTIRITDGKERRNKSRRERSRERILDFEHYRNDRYDEDVTQQLALRYTDNHRRQIVKNETRNQKNKPNQGKTWQKEIISQKEAI